VDEPMVSPGAAGLAADPGSTAGAGAFMLAGSGGLFGLSAVSLFVEVFGAVWPWAEKEVGQINCAASKPTQNRAAADPNCLLKFGDGFIGCLLWFG
jgi:hypothetical protein